MTVSFDHQQLLDAIGHGILVFDDNNNLLHTNRAAATLLANDLKTIQAGGWTVAENLFNANITDPDQMMAAVRTRALRSDTPVRFNIFRSGVYVPCWAAALPQEDGKVGLLITLDVPDWSIVSTLIDRFRNEMYDAVDSTLGHINLINHTLKVDDVDQADEATRKVTRRTGGFTRLIAIHMQRAKRLMTMLERLEDIRTAKLYDNVRQERRKIDLEDFMEDFMEELQETDLLDPETEVEDFLSRIQLQAPNRYYVMGVRRYLTATLQELIRNAIMYSLKATPITIKIAIVQQMVHITVTDEGYGIRKNSYGRVDQPFQRGHQPQIISEFGYGLALYLCKQEMIAMNATLTFESTEGVGTTFTIRLPQWRDEAASSSTE